jgi:hypothetical protein
MALKKRILNVGHSRCVVLPPDWLRYHEDRLGPINEVNMEITNVLTITVDNSKREELTEKVKEEV